MIKTIEYERIDNSSIKGRYVLIDVRSPGEFKKATIPGAINLPLFTDEEREEIGTVYVQECRDKAKRLGVVAASKKLPEIYDRIQQLQKEYKSLIFLCERGGMRSSSIVSLLTSVGVNAFKVLGGYKGYRAYINESLKEVMNGVNFVVIHGNTGVGKTKILKKLEEKGYDVLDLEGCANHRGSLLGSVGIGRQNSQKMFESLVYETLKNRKSNTVFVEAESKRIGYVFVPEHIHNAMRDGVHINVISCIESRVDNILEDYVYDNNDELIESVDKLSKYISAKNIEEYKSKILGGLYREVIEDLMIKYYDPMYLNKKYDYLLETDSSIMDNAVNDIINWYEENKHEIDKEK
ncbi:MAG: tRNA 2-selenouridine(34) synthase MnmH [Clostridium sp.]